MDSDGKRDSMREYILIVEDDNDINHLQKELFGQHGYEVGQAFSGTEALLCMRERVPEAVILDLMLPGMAGEEVLGAIKEKYPQTGVIVSSAKDSVDTRVSLLRAGADDFVVKPFDTEELLARLEAVLRRRGSSAWKGSQAGGSNLAGTGVVERSPNGYGLGKGDPSGYGLGKGDSSGYGVGEGSPSGYGVVERFPNGYGLGEGSPSGYGLGERAPSGYGVGEGIPGEAGRETGKVLAYKDIRIQQEDFLVLVGGQEVSFTKREYLILELLMSNPRKVFTKANIYASVWKEEFLGEDNAVNVHISNIRQKLAKAHPEETYIQTVWGIGFKMK